MDASGEANSVAVWRARITWLISVLLVAAICLAVNRFWGIGSASAQISGARVSGTQAAPANTTGRPVSRPAGLAPPFRTAAPANGAAPAGGGKSAAPQGAFPNQPVSHNASVPSAGELKVMAVVNSEQISRQDLARECLRRYGKEVLETMVNKHLILQACKKYNLIVTEKDVDDEITRIAGKFGLSTDRWLQLLEQERNVRPVEYRKEIIWPTLALRRLAANQIDVTQDELRKAFESEYGPKVKARLIAVSRREKAEEVHAKAKRNPDTFESLAKDFSEDPSAAVMGLIPPIRLHLGDAQLEQVAFGLKKGEVSPIVKVAAQYVILKCEDHLSETYLSGKGLENAREHLRDRIRDQKMRTAAADLFKKLQDEAKVVVVLNDKNLEKQHPGVAAMINGQPIALQQVAEECITRNGAMVLDGEINRLILQQELKRRNKAVTESDISDEVSRAADAYGFVQKDGSPDIERWLQQVKQNDGATVELYVQDAVWPTAALKKLAGTAVQVSAEDLKKGFESNYGERVEVLAIVVSTQRQAQQVWEQARNNATDHFFGELAAQYSVEPASRANHGKVPPIRRHGGQPLVEDHAFKLKLGELSPIIGVGDKFIILRCIGRTKPVVEEMTPEVRQELLKDLQEKKVRMVMTQEFDRLKDAAQIDNFLAGTSQAGRRGKPGEAASVAGPRGLPATSPAPRSGALR